MAGTILCADDDRHFCQILARALGAGGLAGRGGPRRRERAPEIRELDPVLVTLDLMLPRLDGFTVLEMLRKDPALARHAGAAGLGLHLHE